MSRKGNNFFLIINKKNKLLTKNYELVIICY